MRPIMKKTLGGLILVLFFVTLICTNPVGWRAMLLAFLCAICFTGLFALAIWLLYSDL